VAAPIAEAVPPEPSQPPAPAAARHAVQPYADATSPAPKLTIPEHSKITDLMIRFGDLGENDPITPEEFRNPAGIRVGQFQY